VAVELFGCEAFMEARLLREAHHQQAEEKATVEAKLSESFGDTPSLTPVLSIPPRLL
jgi:hypothetical protein